MAEMVDIVDDNGNPTGQVVPRDIAREQSLQYRGAVVWILNPAGEILIQKRSANKAVFPNAWDKSVGGGVETGQTPEEAACREAYEEIGIEIQPDDLIFIGMIPDEYQCGNWYEKLLLYHYVVIGDFKISQMKIQESEVSEVKYVTHEWIESHSCKAEPEYSIMGGESYDLLKKWLAEKL
jgi:isopentenyldiphosphate isomerase